MVYTAMTPLFTPEGAETHLFLVRHGETEFNRQRIVQGRGVDTPLNALGLRQSEALAERATTLALDSVFASTLRRAGETARIVADRVGGLPVRLLAEIEEMSWGRYEGLSSTPERRAAFSYIMKRWGAGEYDYAVEGGESVIDVQRRGLEGIQRIVSTCRGQRVMVVTHGRFLRILLATLLPEYGLARMEELGHRNTALNHLVLADGVWEARRLDCVQHLEEAGIDHGG
jgi:broad specificity phosphatase PhoE